MKGRFNDKSDVDLLIRFSRRKSLLDLVKVERKLSKLLRAKADPITEKSISPYIKST